MIKSLSVFFPAYNEEGNIKKITETAVKFLNGCKFPWEIIIVDDGSTDKTYEISASLAKTNPKIKVIHQANGGYGLALRTGIANAKYEWIAYMDSDGQFDFLEMAKFIDQTENVDAVWGYRLQRQDSFLRSIFSAGWNLSTRLLLDLDLKDINCGFKIFRRDILQKIPPLVSTRGAMINPELAIKIKNSGFKISEVGVNHFSRKSGKSTGASLKVIFQSYFELLKLWLKS